MTDSQSSDNVYPSTDQEEGHEDELLPSRDLGVLRKSFEYGYSLFSRNLSGFTGLASESKEPLEDFVDAALVDSIQRMNSVHGTVAFTQALDDLENSLRDANEYITHARQYVDQLPEVTQPTRMI